MYECVMQILILTMPVRLFALMSLTFNPCSPICTVGGSTVVSLPSKVVTVIGSGGIVIILFTATGDDIKPGTLFIISEEKFVTNKKQKLSFYF